MFDTLIHERASNPQLYDLTKSLQESLIHLKHIKLWLYIYKMASPYQSELQMLYLLNQGIRIMNPQFHFKEIGTE